MCHVAWRTYVGPLAREVTSDQGVTWEHLGRAHSGVCFFFHAIYLTEVK